MSELKYVPTFRSRQQENILLREYDFGNEIYPMIEIIKEFDRKRPDDKQQSFKEVYTDLINDINADRVFVDLPLYLKERASMKLEVFEFSRFIISNRERRTEKIVDLSQFGEKVIPVVSSYFNKTGEKNSVQSQVSVLRKHFKSIGYRVLYNFFNDDWDEIKEIATSEDFIILDLDTIAPYPSPPLRRIITALNDFKTCRKIVLRSAINPEIQNVTLTHDDIVYDADNGIIDSYKSSFKVDAFGDYCGIKKDDLTSGGAISPGFIFYDPVDNQYYGYKGAVKNLSEFETTIVPHVLSGDAVAKMNASGVPYLNDDNKGWQTLLNISQGRESGKSQAKFKKISMDHYIHCIKTKIDQKMI